MYFCRYNVFFSWTVTLCCWNCLWSDTELCFSSFNLNNGLSLEWGCAIFYLDLKWGLMSYNKNWMTWIYYKVTWVYYNNWLHVWLSCSGSEQLTGHLKKKGHILLHDIISMPFHLIDAQQSTCSGTFKSSSDLILISIVVLIHDMKLCTKPGTYSKT